jgi:hypothetical protein
MPVMVILANYADSEASYGLLGPQMAATIIQGNTDYECIVVAVGHEYDRLQLKKTVTQLCGSDKPVVGFSNLGGRADLWSLSKQLKEDGAVTIIGGPQANVDYVGEVDWEKHPQRFHGVSDSFTYALQGPAEQLISLINSRFNEEPDRVTGLVFNNDGRCFVNGQGSWNGNFLSKVNWKNLYRMGSSGLEQLSITTAQVVQQIGCPYAAIPVKVSIDYPTRLMDSSFLKEGSIQIELQGCSFCDVARDKGFSGNLPLDNVLAQIINLPEDTDGRKIPFELINEASLTSLCQLLSAIRQRDINVSQINLVTRADWLLTAEEQTRDALRLAKDMNVRILLSAVGFESFADSILKNLNKGYAVGTNIAAIRLMRQLKEEFPETWFYTPEDGASHGFIHPTPWDTTETRREMNALIFAYGLNQDILPNQSTPLIIHHASALGDWVRELEIKLGVTLKRTGSVIEWW